MKEGQNFLDGEISQEIFGACIRAEYPTSEEVGYGKPKSYVNDLKSKVGPKQTDGKHTEDAQGVVSVPFRNKSTTIHRGATQRLLLPERVAK